VAPAALRFVDPAILGLLALLRKRDQLFDSRAEPPNDPTASVTALLVREGRAAFDRRDWVSAFEALSRADEARPLCPADLQRLALAGYLIGRDDVYTVGLERAHRGFEEAEETAAAAGCAIWLGLHLAESGEGARASGWLARAARLLDGLDDEVVEHGYIRFADAARQMASGDVDGAVSAARDAASIAERFGDRHLLALALHAEGRSLLLGQSAGEQRQDRPSRGSEKIEEGLRLLDEAMVVAGPGDLSPHVTGLLYCSAIGTCRAVYALGRVGEWTAALAEWCDRQPDMVAFTGECRVYRAELFQLRGAWGEAIAEALRAGEQLGEGTAAAALAHYQRGELHRLRGEYDDAEAAFRAASRAGRAAQPGLALLRLARGDEESAAAAIRRALAETRPPLRRARLLPAAVEILLAIGDEAGARLACEELAATAAAFASPALDAMAAYARGAVALAVDDHRGALPFLRRACERWLSLDAPYEAARARELAARACHALGDRDGADLELAAAREVFARCGAAPDTARIDAALRGGAAAAGRPAVPCAADRRAHGLTLREREVLAQLATGRTNRAIAEALFISERTVARHVSNIFGKLRLSSRAAATAFAYEHDLVDPTTNR
jgi:DNA-binding CsgD family transcriptional regulator